MEVQTSRRSACLRVRTVRACRALEGVQKRLQCLTERLEKALDCSEKRRTCELCGAASVLILTTAFWTLLDLRCCNCQSRQQISCLKAVGELHLSYRAGLMQHYSDASFAALRFLNCLHLSGLFSSCCNVVLFFCDFEACSLVTAAITLIAC